MLSNFIIKYWGKALPAVAGGPRWHPVAYHCLDVAAVADHLLASSPGRLAWLAEIADVSPDALRRTFVALIALHDVGKFAPGFQCKVPELWEKLRGGPLPISGSGRHDAVAKAFWEDEDFNQHLGSYFAALNGVGSKLWASVAGHHGQPAAGDGASTTETMPKTERQDAHEFVRAVVSLFPPIAPIGDLDLERTATLSWALAGLTVIADWIGSSQAFFRYEEPIFDLETYWNGGQGLARSARAKAAEAVRKAGVLACEPLSDVREAALRSGVLAHLDDKPLSPLQAAALAVPLPDGPFFALVEDLTGGGKTEAAMILAARVLQAGRASGVYFALPTMATANAMYERLGGDPAVGFLHRDRPGRPSLALDLMEELRPVLADRLAVSLINRRQLTSRDFEVRDGGAVLLGDEARKRVLTAWQERKKEERVHPFLDERIPLGLVPYVQAQMLARHLRGDLDVYPPWFWK